MGATAARGSGGVGLRGNVRSNWRRGRGGCVWLDGVEGVEESCSKLVHSSLLVRVLGLIGTTVERAQGLEATIG